MFGCQEQLIWFFKEYIPKTNNLMRIKKIAIAFVFVGLVVLAGFSYYIYSVMLVSNTAFNGKEAFIFIRSGATYDEVRSDLEPLLIDINTFDVLAKQKKYTSNIRAGPIMTSSIRSEVKTFHLQFLSITNIVYHNWLKEFPIKSRLIVCHLFKPLQIKIF